MHTAFIQTAPGSMSPRLWRAVVGVVLAALLLALAPASAPAALGAPRAHPALLALAAGRPDTRVRVVVQKFAPGGAVEARAVALGGQIIRDLSLIRAFAAELPARAAGLLAREAGVRWITLDAPAESASLPANRCGDCTDTSKLLGAYVQSIGASRLWNEAAAPLQGQGVGVAVVDSGINRHADLGNSSGNSRVVVDVAFNNGTNNNSRADWWGHGTHVAGIIGGNGNKSRGAYIGVAPKVNLINVKVGDDRGQATTSDVVAGLQWVYENHERYNIRVVNISINSTMAESYHTSAFSAAIQLLWFKGLVVVVSGGNNGLSESGVLYPPANDPFVIAVGAADDRGTPDPADDALAPFSAYGITTDGFSKPDIVAPGRNIISLLADNGAELVRGHPTHRVDGFFGGRDYYFRMSGTSMAAAVVSGAAALLLQDEPGLTPNQVKHRLLNTARPFQGSGGAGYLDIFAAVKGTSTESANIGVAPSQLLNVIDSGTIHSAANWTAANWTAANWTAANWTAANWGSVSWDD